MTTREDDQLLSLDCVEDQARCSEYGITSYPTLRLFHYGKPVTNYLGPRTLSGYGSSDQQSKKRRLTWPSILNFVSRHFRPVVTDLKGENIEEFKKSDEVVFIGYVGSNDELARQLFAEIAAKYRDEFSFALVSDEELIRAGNMASPTVICHVNDDGETRSFNAFAEAGALNNFVATASRRVIGELTPYNYQRLHDVRDILLALFD